VWGHGISYPHRLKKSGGTSPVSPTKLRPWRKDVAVGKFSVSEALHCVRCKRSHAAFTTLENQRLCISLSLFLMVQCGRCFGPFSAINPLGISACYFENLAYMTKRPCNLLWLLSPPSSGLYFLFLLQEIPFVATTQYTVHTQACGVSFFITVERCLATRRHFIPRQISMEVSDNY